jgi:hypothetical protein
MPNVIDKQDDTLAKVARDVAIVIHESAWPLSRLYVQHGEHRHFQVPTT